ncbi:MAG: PepSY-associated TM helix domain-containing protein [Rhodomicrobium sp.]
MSRVWADSLHCSRLVHESLRLRLPARFDADGERYGTSRSREESDPAQTQKRPGEARPLDETGKLSAAREMPWYVAALLMSQPLHFGDYGGAPLKIIWALLDLGLIVVLASGIFLWLRKRRADNRSTFPDGLREEGGE